jgi:CheY-like chemotaxis protein
MLTTQDGMTSSAAGQSGNPSVEAAPTILVVDDDDTYRGVVSRLIERAGYRVVQAANGEDALHTLGSEPAVTLIVVDDIMPVLSGREFIERVNADARWQRIPIVLVTANSLSLGSLPDVGPRLTIRKPTDPDALLEMIARHALRQKT